MMAGQRFSRLPNNSVTRPAGEAYEASADYVLCDELGAPFDPARLRRAWHRLMRHAGVRKETPEPGYDLRR